MEIIGSFSCRALEILASLASNTEIHAYTQCMQSPTPNRRLGEEAEEVENPDKVYTKKIHIYTVLGLALQARSLHAYNYQNSAR